MTVTTDEIIDMGTAEVVDHKTGEVILPTDDLETRARSRNKRSKTSEARQPAALDQPSVGEVASATSLDVIVGDAPSTGTVEPKEALL
jgi:hypothetical protein